MKSIKAIAIGCVFIILSGLLVQLAYIFIAVGYIYLAKSYPFLNDIAIYFRYIIGFPVLFSILFAGGYITADFSPDHVLRNCLMVAMLTMSLTVLSALSYSEITVTGFVVMVMSLFLTVAGGLYQRYSVLKSNTVIMQS